MKQNHGDYAPWLLGQTVENYCDMSVMPIGSEIENVSLSALKDVLLSPAGIALEVLYLDRSDASEVNMHRFDPVNPVGGATIGTIRLLYRPGHYDLLYKTEDFPPPPPPISAYLQFASQPYQDHVQDLGAIDFMAGIPGMSLVNPHQAWMSTSSYGGDFFGGHAPVQQCAQPVPPPTPISVVPPAPQPQLQPQPVYVPATPTHLVAPPVEMPHELAIRTVSHGSLGHPGFQHQFAGPFRPSAWQLEEGFMQATSHAPFQTSIFRK